MSLHVTQSKKMTTFQNIKKNLLNKTAIQHLIATATHENKSKVKIFEQQELPYTNGFLYKDLIETSVFSQPLIEQLRQLFLSPYEIYGKTIKRGSLFSTKRIYYQVFIKWKN